jgi:hypothetical protein
MPRSGFGRGPRASQLFRAAPRLGDSGAHEESVGRGHGRILQGEVDGCVRGDQDGRPDPDAGVDRVSPPDAQADEAAAEQGCDGQE